MKEIKGIIVDIYKTLFIVGRKMHGMPDIGHPEKRAIMMELPESYMLSRQITKELVGKIISEVIILQTPHKFCFFKSDVDTYADQLEGQTIVGATFKGGMLEIDTEDTMIVFSDGVTPRYYEDKKDFPKKHQLAFLFDDDTALFCTIRMYGFIDVCPVGTCKEEYYVSSSTKPNPMTEGFTYAHFRSLYDGTKKLSAKALLATEQRIPGLGNGVLQDILWDAGIDPRYKMEKASEEDCHALYDSTVKMLRKMCAEGGRDTENDIFGNPGGYITQLSKKSYGEPCMKCGYPRHKTNYMGGTVYFCEKCQKLG